MSNTKATIASGLGSIAVGGADMDELLRTEWLLTNSRGGFASGTIVGCNTRRYHGLLVGAIRPPAERIAALSNCFETITTADGKVEFINFEFEETMLSKGLKYCTNFRKDMGVHFDYDLGYVKLTKSIYLLPDCDTVAVVYNFTDVYTEFEFSVRPFAAMRDFHSLQKCDAITSAHHRNGGVIIRTNQSNCGELFLKSDRMNFEADEQWWHNFLYRRDRQRQQDCTEDLWSPGTFQCRIDTSQKVVLWASLGRFDTSEDIMETACCDVEVVVDSLMLREKELAGSLQETDPTLEMLCSAAGQFVVDRNIADRQTSTILAGYPWFLDWGRDTFIALPGLLLCTGRFETAASVLTTFAEAVSDGMIPNRFDDYGGDPHYNSIDASLWFVHAAFEYLQITRDRKTFNMKLFGAVQEIMDSYHNGTRFDIGADMDGLISGGDADTQLTWMDAKCNDIAFTPRYGKAVEINALWYSNLCRLAKFYDNVDIEAAGYYKALAKQAGDSFAKSFWNEETGYLNDCILPDGTVDTSLRPNQIYAVSLPFSALDAAQQKCVVGVVQRELFTPYGLRTLNRDNKRYAGRYEGSGFKRDSAYHNGTVWPHLMGAFVEAYLRVNDFSKESKRKTRRFLRPLLAHLIEDGCIGSISEIFDGDEPQEPRGCFAQAWAVAEVLRAYQLIGL